MILTLATILINTNRESEFNAYSYSKGKYTYYKYLKYKKGYEVYKPLSYRLESGSASNGWKYIGNYVFIVSNSY